MDQNIESDNKSPSAEEEGGEGADVQEAAVPRNRAHLENSRLLRWDRVAATPKARRAVSALLVELVQDGVRIRKLSARKEVELGAVLEAFVMDLYAAAKADPERFLAYPRSQSYFSPRGRYHHPTATLAETRKVVAFLENRGFATTLPGSNIRTTYGDRWGYRSRIRALPTLVEFLEDRFALTLDDVGAARTCFRLPPTEVAFDPIRLKAPARAVGGVKELVNYQDTAETVGMRLRLDRYNAFIACRHLGLDRAGGSAVAGEPDDDSVDVDDRADPGDRSAGPLWRVFNNQDFGQGGRFYGGWWQGLSKADRRRILIDGEPTIELDFDAMHARMVYDLERRPLPPEVDPYVCVGLHGEAGRKLTKTAFAQLLNIGPYGRPEPPAWAAGILPDGTTYRDFLRRVQDEHGAVGGWFRKQRGLELQRIDSDIADDVMSALTSLGIVCLPVHDSMIVPASAEETLRSAMIDAYQRRVAERGGVGVIPLISGPRDNPGASSSSQGVIP